jgi:uncharacterized membrane protein YebE (DUF533 family)
MFNAEQLLGKMMAEMVGSGSDHKKYKKNKGGGIMNSLTSTLMSGQGLMTAIGLGVGAYEILKSKQGGSPPPVSSMGAPPVSPPSVGYGVASSAASPVSTPPPIPGGPAVPSQDLPSSTSLEEKLALRLIQVMIAAAHADGRMDHDEEGKILARLQGQGISQEEKRFLLAEMHDPKSIEQLTSGVNDPRVAQAMYTLAASAVIVDTPEERAWLDQLGTALSISEGMRRFIEEEE